MTTAELEQAILDYIRNWHSADYVGTIEVTVENGVYKLALGIPSYMCLTTIGGEFSSDEDFLNFIYEEIRKRNYMKVDFYKVYRTETIREE